MLYVRKNVTNGRIWITEDGRDYTGPDGNKWETSAWRWSAFIRKGAIPFFNINDPKYVSGYCFDRADWKMACRIRWAVEDLEESTHEIKVCDRRFA